MDKEILIKALSDIVGAEHVATEKETLQNAAKDYIGYRQFQRHSGNNMVNIGACVVRPQNTQQVAEVLKFLNENKVDITPRAGGSSVTKSIEPVEGGVIIDCSDMNGIIEVNETDMYVTAKSGTSLDWMEKQLNEMGYTAGHFPQSHSLHSRFGCILYLQTIVPVEDFQYLYLDSLFSKDCTYCPLEFLSLSYSFR